MLALACICSTIIIVAALGGFTTTVIVTYDKEE